MLSEKIYTLRRKSGLSQEQLAEKIGVSRQAISKWEGGLSTPELDKLKALSAFFQISIDELTGEQEAIGSSAGAEQKPPAGNEGGASCKIGVALCLVGVAGLILFGVFMLIWPSSAERLEESSVITLNGTGILMALFLALMGIGVVLVLKKK